MAAWQAIIALALLAEPVLANKHTDQASLSADGIEVDTPHPQQHLRICNAYAAADPMDIIRGETGEQLTGDSPLGYKECRDFSIMLEEGDELNFRNTKKMLGSFTATGVPKDPSPLLLVAHRRSQNSHAISFQSHQFANLETPQIAVIDAYRGPQKGFIAISDYNKVEKDVDSLLEKDSEKDSKEGKKRDENEEKDRKLAEMARVMKSSSEELQYNSVVSIGAGKYDMALVDPKGKRSQESLLEISGARTFVAMRVGTGERNFGQELLLIGAAGAPQLPLVALAVALLSVLGMLGA